MVMMRCKVREGVKLLPEVFRSSLAFVDLVADVVHVSMRCLDVIVVYMIRCRLLGQVLCVHAEPRL